MLINLGTIVNTIVHVHVHGPLDNVCSVQYDFWAAFVEKPFICTKHICMVHVHVPPFYGKFCQK